MDLVTRWRELVRAEALLPEHELEEIEARLDDDTMAALAAGGPARELLIATVRAEHPDSPVRERLLGVLTPPASRAAEHPDEFRSHPEVGVDPGRMPIRMALGLPVADALLTSPDLAESTRSWFGGRPAVPADAVARWEHPRRSDGRPLDHVVQVDLADEAANQGIGLAQRIGLPDDGVLHLFHDLETFGWEASDDVTAWRVLWHSTARDPEVGLEYPAGDDVRRVPAPTYPINAQAMATVPPALDFDAVDEAEWERYERAALWLEEYAHSMNTMSPRRDQVTTPWDPEHVPLPPMSRMGGYGVAETNQELVRLLDRVLPLRGDEDGHYLLFDINPLAITDSEDMRTWFHGGRHLEVWIRKRELDARLFANVWCVIRTDN